MREDYPLAAFCLVSKEFMKSTLKLDHGHKHITTDIYSRNITAIVDLIGSGNIRMCLS